MKNTLKTIVFLATFAIIFSFITAKVFAQKTKDSSKDKKSFAPKVIKVDEITIKEILKPNGKPLLVNFWATWCIPCREEFPELVEIAYEYKDKIDLITISLDDLAEINRDVPKFLNEMKATMPAYLLKTNDENAVIGSISKDWTGGLPFTVLYDSKGGIAYTRQGKIKPQIVKSKIDELINESDKMTSIKQIVSLPSTSEFYTFEKGVKDAQKDIAEGKYIIKYYGLVPTMSVEDTEKLRREYGIKVIYHGCLVSPGMAEYGKGYNKISKAAIKRKFNLDF